MTEKRRWRVDVDIASGFGTGFATITFEGIMSTSEEGAKKQIRSRMRKHGVKSYSANNHPVRATPIYTEREAYEILLIEGSQDYGTTIQNLVKMCIEDAKDIDELKSLLNDRLESLADQCYEMMEQI